MITHPCAGLLHYIAHVFRSFGWASLASSVSAFLVVHVFLLHSFCSGWDVSSPIVKNPDHS